MSSGNRVPPALTQPVLSTGPMINDAIRRACCAGRIANPRQRCWARPRGPAAGAYPQHGSGTAQPGSYHSAELIGQTREFSATMASMSASDAAPLPRLGEVFFDVRGSSRSMRLSWYANTGIAVFSIWQGGTCTGTFRLPLDDLSRLVDSLGRGLSDGPVQATGGQGATGPIALGGQRAPLAIGAAPMEAFTGAMNVLSDEQAAAYGVTRPPRPAAAQNGDGYAAWPDANGFAPAPSPNGYGRGVPDFSPVAVNGFDPASANGYGPAAAGFGPADGFGPGGGGYQSDNADYTTDPS